MNATKVRTTPYRILSIDGGGLRGVIPLAILERLDAAVDDWRSRINMYAGTSTGGLIALGLAKGMSPQDLLNIYLAKGPLIFERSLWHEVKDIGQVTGPKYDSTNRLAVCKEMFGTVRLGDLRSKDGNSGHVVITSFDLDDKIDPDSTTRRWKAKIFHNMPIATGHSDDLEFAYRVAMRTSAAPTYFSSYDGFVDGGVFANNPSMCALAQVRDRRLKNPIPLEAVRMLSLSTGVYPHHINGDENWGLAEWAPHLVSLLMDGVNEVAEFETKQLMENDSYCRIPLRLSTDIALDDVSELGTLQRIGNAATLTDATKFLKTYW